MKRYLFALTLLFGLDQTVQAQNKPYYTWAFGVRAGSKAASSGITVKAFVSKSSALELIASYANSGLGGTLLFEQHFSLFGLKELQAYYGGGGHYTSKSGYGYYVEVDSRNSVYRDGKAAYGLDAVFGITYKFPTIPVAFSMDLKPFIEFNQFGSYTKAIDASLGIKLAF